LTPLVWMPVEPEGGRAGGEGSGLPWGFLLGCALSLAVQTPPSSPPPPLCPSKRGIPKTTTQPPGRSSAEPMTPPSTPPHGCEMDAKAWPPSSLRSRTHLRRTSPPPLPVSRSLVQSVLIPRWVATGGKPAYKHSWVFFFFYFASCGSPSTHSSSYTAPLAQIITPEPWRWLFAQSPS
jgi:hypothetical protein